MMDRMGAVSWGRIVTGVACLGTVGLIAVGVSMCGNEPEPRCAVPGGEAIASYTAMGPPTVVPGAPAGANCDNWVPPTLQGLGSGAGCGTNGCAPITGNVVAGEAFGLETYYPSPNDENWVNEPSSISIKNEYVGVRINDYLLNILPGLGDGGLANYPYMGTPPAAPPADGNNSNRPYSWGVFDTVFAVNGVCTISHLTGSKMVYPDIPAHAAANGTGGTTPPAYGPSANCMSDADCVGTAPCVGADPSSGTAGFCTDIADQPETAIDYEWSNVRVVVDTSNGNIGGQIYADLTITQDSCTQQFHAVIVSPRAQCNGTDNNGNTVADPTLCAANANSDPDNYPVVGDASEFAKIYGSGLFASVPVNCQTIYPPAATGGDGGASPPPADFECMPTKTSP